MLTNLKNPDKPALPTYDAANPPDFPEVHVSAAGDRGNIVESGRGPSFNEMQKRLLTSKENMRRFIKAGAKFSMGTDTGAFFGSSRRIPTRRR